MRLIVHGQQAFGKDALAKILDAGVDEVVAVYCARKHCQILPQHRAWIYVFLHLLTSTYRILDCMRYATI